MDDPAAGMQKLSKRDTAMYGLGFGCDTGDASELLEQLGYTSSEYNFTGYSNAQVDQLADLAKSTMDQTKRRKYLQQAIELLSNDYVYIPLYTNPLIHFVSDNVELSWDKSGSVKAANASAVKTVLEKPTFMKFLTSFLSLSS